MAQLAAADTSRAAREGRPGRFWTYTCVNWLRQLPYLRAWDAKYRDQGLAVIGGHIPECSFEHDAGNVRRAERDMGIGYPVALHDKYAVWGAFASHYWPALYFATPRDASGIITSAKADASSPR